MLWLCGDSELQNRLESVERLISIFKFGHWRFPSALLSRFTALYEVTIGFNYAHGHGTIKDVIIPGSWKSISKLNLQSPSLVAHIDSDLATLFPNLRELSMCMVFTPEVQSIQWKWPPYLESICIASRRFITQHTHFFVYNCPIISYLPETVTSISIDSTITLDNDYRNLGIRWPPHLLHLNLGLLNINQSYASYLERIAPILEALNEKKKEGPKSKCKKSVPSRTIASSSTFNILGDDHMIIEDENKIFNFLGLPNTLETLTLICPISPHPSLFPRNLRIFRNLDNNTAVPRNVEYCDRYFETLPGLLQEAQLRATFNCSPISPAFLSSSLLKYLHGATCEITSKFKVEHLLLLPTTLKRLNLIGNIPSHRVFSLPPNLTYLHLMSAQECHPQLILPESLKSLIVSLSGSFSDQSTLIPPFMHSLIVTTTNFWLIQPLQALPRYLVVLEVAISGSLLCTRDFDPHFLPPLLRHLKLVFGNKPGCTLEEVNWVRWWAHIPQHLPLESLELQANENPVPPASYFPQVTDDTITHTRSSHPSSEAVKPHSALEAAQLGLPLLHPTLISLLVSVKAAGAEQLAKYITRRLPPSLCALALHCYDIHRFEIPFDLIRFGPPKLRHASSKSISRQDLAEWLGQGENKYFISWWEGHDFRSDLGLEIQTSLGVHSPALYKSHHISQ